MKTIILFTISLLFFSEAWASGNDDFEDSKVFDKVVAISEGFELEITNKHGDIIFENWDKDSISVQVTISAQSADLKKLEDIMKSVEIDFNAHSDYLAITTEWLNPGKSFKADVMSFLGEQSISVDYLIKLPKHIELDVTNRYGNIKMGNYDGKLKLDLSHGSISARKIKNARSIKIKYGKLKIKEIEVGDILARFSNVNIDKVGELDLNSSSSEIEIETADKIVLKSFSDDIEIEELTKLQINSSASSIEIEKLKTSIKGEMKYGDLDVDEIANDFTSITLNANSTDIDFTFKSDVALKYDIELEKGRSFTIPSKGNKLIKDSRIENTHKYVGSFSRGTMPESAPLIEIVAKGSYIEFDVEQ